MYQQRIGIAIRLSILYYYTEIIHDDVYIQVTYRIFSFSPIQLTNEKPWRSTLI